jgi:ribosome hibernation promoting factor
MQINVTFRHVDPTPALRAHAEEKLDRMVKKYLRRPVDAHVILSVAKERHVAEITLQADHVTMFAKEETHDLYSAIDLAVEKLEHQAQKLKARRKEHKGPSGARVPPEEAPADGSATAGTAGARPRVITRRVSAKPMHVDEAIEMLGRTGDEFLFFLNARSQTMAVLYRRKDGNYGLIESEGR